MEKEEVKQDNTSLVTIDEQPLVVMTDELNKESIQIINQVITEADINKTKDLSNLFNINHKKKTMIRLNKIGELQDILIDQAIDRFTKRPDEIDNNTLIQAMKTTQDMAERNQKILVNQDETPLIQINQQNNEINLNENGKNYTKEARDHVKDAVAAILAGIKPQNNSNNNLDPKDEIVEEEVK